MARFTVFTDRLIRMEYANKAGQFEDRATLAVLNRNNTVPSFASSEEDGVLTITTDSVELKYTVGKGFSSETLSVTSTNASSTPVSWSYQPGAYGNVASDNLLGTIKSLDQLDNLSLNCTINNSTQVHDEVLHCEWGLISRSGWAVMDDTTNACLDENDWWSTPLYNQDAIDLYGFFHGHDYRAALKDYTLIGGKTIMVPRFASGVWWSRWYNLNNFDTETIVNQYETHGLPLDVFVIDMDWHTKDDWSGFTFDTHLFPYPADSMARIKANGLHITLNIHDASGVNNWDAEFKPLIEYLGLPADSTKVPFNLVNSTVAYAVEDIVLGDLIYNKNIDFWWIDWQQGGQQGGMDGGKQNPTIWTDHLRCTDRHRTGDDTRAMVLARWGGMGTHRYQVGFSGDVLQLTWTDLAYQPYFSWTGSNVLYGFWSHDMEGPATDLEMYTRWLQWGTVSGVMRSHDRGMSGGGCANDATFDCSIVEPWAVAPENFEANRMALRAREHLVPYIYNAHRQAFDTGLSIIRGMYYDYPELDNAYMGDLNGNYAQYMFGDDIMIAPIVSPGVTMTPSPLLTSKTVWVPPGTWYNALSGAVTTVTADDQLFSKNYTLYEIPVFYKAGAVIPFLPIRNFASTVGIATQQYNYLGFSIIPGAASGQTVLYEDNGNNTDYLTKDLYVWTTAAYERSAGSIAITISSTGSYTEFPVQRSYQIRLPNGVPPSSVTVGGEAIAYNRYGDIASRRRTPTASQWYYDFQPEANQGLGVVVDIVNQATDAPVKIILTDASPAPTPAAMSGVLGAILRANAAKLNLDADRSTPGSNSVGPAYLSVLASAGEALEYLAYADVVAFTELVNNIPAMYNNATLETTTDNSPRTPFSAAVLANAMM